MNFVSTTIEKPSSLLLGNFLASRNLRHFLLSPCRPLLLLLSATPLAIGRFIVVLYWSFVGFPLCVIRMMAAAVRRKENRIISYLADRFIQEMPERFKPQPELYQQKQFVSLWLFPSLEVVVERDKDIVGWDSCKSEEISNTQDHWLLSWLKNQNSLFPSLMWFQMLNAWTVNLLRSLTFTLWHSTQWTHFKLHQVVASWKLMNWMWVNSALSWIGERGEKR